MGLISDRKNRANKRDRNDAINGSSKSLAMYPQHPPPHPQHLHQPPPHLMHAPGPGPPPPPSSNKRGVFGPQVLPTNGNGLPPIKNNAPKYPAGYYTTPVHSSSWGGSAGHLASSYHHHHGHHPSQPKFQANVNPRYQTWVAPRKQPSLGQLVRRKREAARSTDLHRERKKVDQQHIVRIC